MSEASVRSSAKIYKDLILTGTVLAIDPSSGAYNNRKKEQSYPGFALFEAGELTISGTVPMDGKKNPDIHKRLALLYDHMRTQFGPFAVDVLVIERLRGKFAHEYLKWSVPVFTTSVRAGVVIEMPISTWKALASDDYKKSDEADAICIGQALIKLAQEQ